MKKKVDTKTILIDSIDQIKTLEAGMKQLSGEKEKYLTFFEYAPVALWIEDFSKVKIYIDKVAKENNTDIQSYILSNPNIVEKLGSLVTIKDVNTTALNLYKAKSKQELLANLDRTFTKSSGEAFSKLLIDILKGSNETEIETVNNTLDGEEFNVSIKFKVIDGSQDTLENVVVSVENITERIKSRTALADSEKRYKESQEVAKMGSWFYDYNEKSLHWSHEAYNLLGVKHQKEKLSIKFYLSFVHEDDKKLVKNFHPEFLLKNQNQNLQYRIITEQGAVKYISEKRSVLVENGRILKIIGICQDVTETVLSEQKLNATKNLFSNTLSSIKDGFVILDYNSNYLYVNQEAADLLEVTNPQDLIGKHIWTEFPEKKGDAFFDNYQKALETRKPVRFDNYFEPWNRWFENRIIPSDEGMLLFFHEITDKKISENKIKEAYNIINKSSSVAVLSRYEHNFPVEFASENTLNLTGYAHSEFLTNKIKIVDIIHPEDLNAVTYGLSELDNSVDKNHFHPKPFRIITKNKSVKWVQTKFYAIRNKQHKITHVQGVVEDITERKKAEDLLFESNQRLKDQFNNTPLASIIWDVDFNVIEWNDSAEHIFGYTAEEAKGKNTKDLLTPPNLVSEMKKVTETLLGKKAGHRNTNNNITKSGKIITCDWYNVTLKDANGNIIGVASLVDDITDRVNSKRIIEKSEKKYRDIFEKTVDAVFILKEGQFIDCNESAINMFGYLNKDLLLTIHPSKISPEKQIGGESSFMKSERMMKIALENGSNRFRWLHQQKSGHIFPAEVSLTRIDERERVPTIHAVVKDITERVKNEALEDVLYNISKAALTINDFNEFSLFIKNELHKLIDTSNFYIALYNKETDIITTPIFVDEKEDIQEFPAKNTLTGYVIKSKEPLMLNEQSQRDFIERGKISLVGELAKIWIGVPLKIQENVFGAIVVQSYVNEHAYTENDVQLLEFVADQISTTIQRKKAENELKRALTKAQESDKLKSSFLANMSHEIRTPMNGIIGFSELFLEPNLVEKERRKYAEIVINSSKQLLSIVNDILDISKIEAGVVQLNYENVNINKLIDDLYIFFKQKATDNNIELRSVKGLENFKSMVEIDSTKLNQVLTNLLSNAFKFTEEGSIEFGYQLLDNKLKFHVKDTGVGIEEELQNKIFDRFIQAKQDLSKKLQGTGLGLAISKKFIQLFGGEIWLESSNKGTTVYFTIPYRKSKIPLITSVIEEQKLATQVKDQKLTILVAEDEEYNMMYINELFSKTNFNIIEADNGRKAIELAHKHPEIDLILMDIKMPIMDGNTAMKEIKKEKPNLPIIALSAFAMESDKKAALESGFNAYLTKPIDKKLLFSMIGKFTN